MDETPRFVRVPANLPPGAQGQSNKNLHRLIQKIRSITGSLWVS